MRLNRYVAASSTLSRRAADAAIAEGRVTVNGRPGSLGQEIVPGDTVTLDGAPIRTPQAHTYLAFHKPAGAVSSHRRQGNTPTVYDLLPSEFQNLNLSGRLDLESSGLILLSDDGDFIQSMQHPSADKVKVYEVTLDHTFKPKDLDALEVGVELEDGPSHLRVTHINDANLTVELSEGRNRQVRRTFGKLGYTIVRLHRVAIGPYQLGELRPGAWREITP